MVNLWDNETQCTPDLSNFKSLITNHFCWPPTGKQPSTNFNTSSITTLSEANAKPRAKRKHPWTLKQDITLNIPLMLQYTWLSLLSISLLCLGLCTVCVCEWLLGNVQTVVLIGISSHLCSFFPLCARLNRETKGYKVLIITRCPLRRWKRDLSHVTLSP